MNWKACQHIELSSSSEDKIIIYQSANTTMMTDKTVTCTMKGSIIKQQLIYLIWQITQYLPGAKFEEEQMDAAF